MWQFSDQKCVHHPYFFKYLICVFSKNAKNVPSSAKSKKCILTNQDFPSFLAPGTYGRQGIFEKPQLNFKSLQLVIGPKTFRNFGQLAAQKDHFANFGFCGCKTSDFDSKQIIRNCFFKLNIRKNIKLLNRRPRCGLKSLQSCQKLDHTQMDVLNCVHLFLKECTCSKFVKHQTFKVKKMLGSLC